MHRREDQLPCVTPQLGVTIETGLPTRVIVAEICAGEGVSDHPCPTNLIESATLQFLRGIVDDRLRFGLRVLSFDGAESQAAA